TPSSLIEQIIPLDSIPRSFTFFILKLPGSTPPGFATTTFCPCATLGAPQIICNGSDSPTSTWHSFNLSAFGCCSHSCTYPTTTFVLFSETIYSIPLTSIQDFVIFSAKTSGV